MRWLLILTGLAFMVWGFLFDPGILSKDAEGVAQYALDPERMLIKPLIFGFGAVQFLAGFVLLAASWIVTELRNRP